MWTRQLFERAPILARTLPHVELCRLPTPLDRLDERLWVKRDDRTSDRYGGNKTRKLEFLLAEAERRGGPVITTGATGSHFALATALHAEALGIEVEVVRFPQPSTPHVEEMAAALDAQPNVTIFPVARDALFPVGLARRAWARRHDDPLVVGPGGSSPLGALGYVEGALELARQWRLRHPDETPPDCIVTAASSMGTVAGLSVGLAVAGWRDTTVVAVRVADPIMTNGVALSVLVRRTAALLAPANWRIEPVEVEIDTDQLGGGYGEPTAAGGRATDAAAAWGLELEPTYTAKAFATVLERHGRGERVLFLQTFAGHH